MSKRQADLFEKELAKAQKKRVELYDECSSLKKQLAASHKKAAAFEAANEVHTEEAKEHQLSLLESKKNARHWRARAENLKSDNDLLKSEARKLKADKEKLRSENEKLESDYERLRQWVVSCPIQGFRNTRNAAGRVGNLETESQQSAIERAPCEINEEKQEENVLEDELDEQADEHDGNQQGNRIVVDPNETVDGDEAVSDGENGLETENENDGNPQGRSGSGVLLPASTKGNSLEAENSVSLRNGVNSSKRNNSEKDINKNSAVAVKRKRVENSSASQTSPLDIPNLQNVLAQLSPGVRTLFSVSLTRSEISPGGRRQLLKSFFELHAKNELNAQSLRVELSKIFTWERRGRSVRNSSTSASRARDIVDVLKTLKKLNFPKP